MRSEARRAWWASVLMLGSVVIVPVLVGVLSVPLQADLGLGNRELGLAVSAFWASTALAAFALGRYVDRFGWRRAAVLGLGLCLVSQLAIAASVSPALLVGALVVGGVAYGIVAPTSNLTVVEEIPARLRGTALGAKQSAAPVAGLIAGLAVPAVALTVGWRWAFVLVGLLAIGATVASWPGRGRGFPPLRPHPAPTAAGPSGATAPAAGVTASTGSVPGAGAPDVAGGTGSTGSAAGAPDAAGGTGPTGRPLPLLPIAVAAGLGTLPIGVLTTFSTQSLGRVGIDTGTAGIVVAAASVASLCARILAGWLTDRRGSDGLLPAAAMIGLGAVGMIGMASGTTALTVAGVIVAFCGGWGWPALLLLGVLTYHPDRAGTASGRFQLGTAMGAAVGPLLFATVSDAAGFTTAWSVVAACTVLSAVLVALNGRGRTGRATALAGGTP